MTNSQLGETIGMMWAAFPGGIGMWGVLAGIQQWRVGPIIVGLGFCLIGWFTYRIFQKAVQQWTEKEGK